MKQKFLNFAVLAALSGFALAASVPNTFTANTPAVASQVNANFGALVDAVTTLENRVAALEGTLTAASVAGTYRLLKYGQFYFASSGGGTEAIYCHGGGSDSTVTLHANGSFDLSYRELETCGGSVGGHRPQVAEASNSSGTWQLVGNAISLDFGDGDPAVFKHGAGGRFFIEVVAKDSTNSENTPTRDYQILALIRQ